MLVMAVFVASCGDPDGGDGGDAAVGGNVDADVGDAAGTTTMGEVDESEYDKDARFVWAARTMARSLNPHLTPFTGGSVPSLRPPEVAEGRDVKVMRLGAVHRSLQQGGHGDRLVM